MIEIIIAAIDKSKGGDENNMTYVADVAIMVYEALTAITAVTAIVLAVLKKIPNTLLRQA